MSSLDTQQSRVVNTVKLTPPVRLLRDEAVPAPPGQPAVAVDVDFERRLVTATQIVEEQANAQLLAALQDQLAASDALLQPGSGATLEDVRLAAAMVGLDSEKAPAFAGNIAKLRAMGFAQPTACGALLAAENNVEAALDRLTS